MPSCLNNLLLALLEEFLQVIELLFRIVSELFHDQLLLIVAIGKIIVDELNSLFRILLN